MFQFLNKFVPFPFLTFSGLLYVAVLANMYTVRNGAEAAYFNANDAGLFIGSDFQIQNHEYLHCKVDSVVAFLFISWEVLPVGARLGESRASVVGNALCCGSCVSYQHSSDFPPWIGK